MDRDNNTFDGSLINKVRSTNANYKTFLAPQVDLEEYVKGNLTPSRLDTPDDYGVTNWVNDAYGAWDLKRNEVNYDTQMGNYQLLESEIIDIEDAQQYLTNLNLIARAQDTGDLTLLAHAEEAKRQNKELKEAYDRINNKIGLSGDVNTQYQQLVDTRDSKIAELQESIDRANEYLARVNDIKSKNAISDYYQQKEQDGIFDYSLDSFLYKLPGIMGSSSSSLKTQTLSTVLSFAGMAIGAGLTPFTGGTSMAMALWAIGATNMALGWYQGTEENKAEVYSNYKDRMKQFMSKKDDNIYKDVLKEASAKHKAQHVNENEPYVEPTEEELLNMALTGQIDVQNEKFHKGMREALHDVEELYVRDMAQTTGVEAILTALELVPFGKVIKSTAKGKKLLDIAASTKSKLSSKLYDKVHDITDFGMKSIDKMQYRRAKNFVLDFTGRQLAKGVSEMVEESGQYVNGQNYIADKYDGKDPSWVEAIWDNTVEGVKSTAQFLMPWDNAMTTDEQKLENARSGFVMGLFNVGNVIGSGIQIAGARKQYQADNWVANNVTADFFADKESLQKGEYYADMAGKNRETHVMRAFEEAKKIGLAGVDEQTWNEEEERALRIVNFAKSNSGKRLAEQRDLKPGTKEFNEYVSLVDYYRTRYENAKENDKEIKKLLEELILNESVLEDAVAGQFLEGDGEGAFTEETYTYIEAIKNAARLNAKKQALEQVLNDLTQESTDLQELYAKYGITYNKADLSTVQSMIHKQYDGFMKEYNEWADAMREQGVKGEMLLDVELNSIHKDMVRNFKTQAYAEVDYARAYEDYYALITDARKDPKVVELTRKKLDKYHNVQKANAEFEQAIQDDYHTSDEKAPVIPVEPTPEDESFNNTVALDTEVTPEEQSVDEEIQNEIEEGVMPTASVEEEPKATKIEEEPAASEQEQTTDDTEHSEDGNGSEVGTYKGRPAATAEELTTRREDLENQRKEIEEARKPIVQIATKATGKSRSAIQRMRDKYGYSREDYTDAELDQQPTSEWNAENPYGKAYLDAEKDRDSALQEIEQDIAKVMTVAFPYTSWKYNNPRNPYFMLGDLEEVLALSEDSRDFDEARNEAIAATEKQLVDLEESVLSGKISKKTYDDLWKQLNQKIEHLLQQDLAAGKALINTPLQNLLYNIYDLNDAMKRFEDAIFKVESKGMQSALEEVKSAQEALKTALEAYRSQEVAAQQDKVDVSKLNTYSERGHRLSGWDSHEFALASANPDFITASTFTVEVRSGHVVIVARYKGQEIPMYMNQDAQSADMIKKIEEFLKQQSKDPTLEIVPVGFDRTNGKPINGAPRLLSESFMWHIGNDPYAINSDNTEIFVGVDDTTTRRAGEISSQASASRGGIYWHAKVFHPETGKYKDMGVKLVTAKLGEFEGLTDTVIDLLVNSNQATYTTKDGVQTPFTPQQLLDFIVFNGVKTAITDDNKGLYDAEQLAIRQSRQLYLDDQGKLVIGTTKFDLTELASDENIRKQAAELLKDFNFRISETSLYQEWGAQENEDNIFKGLRSWFKLKNADKITVVPGAIEFDKEMVGLGSNPARKKGISTLGYYVSKGLIKTDVDHLENALVYFKDVVLRKKDDATVAQEIEQAIEKASEPTDNPGNDPIADFFDQVFAPFVGEPGPKRTDEQKAEIRRTIERLTGLKSTEEFDFTDTVIGITASGMQVLGATRVDSITLYEQAPEGVEFHEAWHRISNLLMAPHKRNKMFDRLRKKAEYKGKDDVALDEMLAEDYREFQLGVGKNIDYETNNLFKRVWAFIKTWKNLKDFQMAKLYYAINRGKYRNIKPSEENIKRFKELYKEGYIPFTIRGQKFENFPNQKSLDEAVTGMAFLLFNMPYTITDPVTGEKRVTVLNISDYNDISAIPFDGLIEKIRTSENKAVQELWKNWDFVEKLLKAKLAQYQVKAVNKTADQDIENVDAGESNSMHIDDYTKANYLVDPFDNAPAEVKFFFSTTPLYVPSTTGTGFQMYKSSIGWPMFVNPRKMWNTAINDLHNVSTQEELEAEINKLAESNPLYIGVRRNLQNLLNKAKSTDETQRIQAEVTLTKIITTLHSHKNDFLTVKASDNNGSHQLDIIDNTVENKSKSLTPMWSQALFAADGVLRQDENGDVQFTEDGKQRLHDTMRWYNAICKAFDKDGKLVSKGVTYDLHELANQQRVKSIMIRLLANFGIDIDMGTIDQMLQNPEYGNGPSYDKLKKFVYTDVSIFGGMYALFDRMNKLLLSDNLNTITVNTSNQNTGTINTTDIWNTSGFAKALANAYVIHHGNSDNLMNYGADNNLVYGSSQNNFVTDRVDELNRMDDVVQKLLEVPYSSSSLVLEQVNTFGTKLKAETFINFKTTNPGDTGSDYHGITDLEDYISKLTLVLNDRILFPTIADKKTYHVLKGIKLPHESFKNYFSNNFYPRFLTFGDQTVSRLIDYAKSELEAIEQCMNQLDPNHPDYITPERRIKNYHTPTRYKENGVTHTVEPNGTRFRFLTGVYVIDEKGQKTFVSFNDPQKSSKQNLETAKRYFFNLNAEMQEAMINGILNERLNEELAYAIKLGLIEGDASNTNSIKNKLLDGRAVEERAAKYSKRGFKNAESLAVMDIIADYMTNTLISINEIERIFVGDPAFYKIQYDSKGIVDISVDKIKRHGSLTSTGRNNRLDFEDFDPEYTCAELKDFEITSRQYADTLVPLFEESALRETVKQMYGVEATLHQDGSNKTVEELREEFKDAVKLAKAKAKAEVSGYSSDINVADAAVYVTPKFYAKMMRAIGEWSPEIAEAYRILTNPKNDDERNWESVAKAYHKVMKASLKPLKYMAFGHRFEHGLSVPYFNKMALFPLFEQVATGDMRKLYDRMTEEGNEIDMVLFESAVKVGSKNPVSFDSDLHTMTTYKQNMAYLRQQLATDPHTHPETMVGTLMLKVALANLDLQGNYGFGDNKVKGSEIRDAIFGAMNKLSDLGRARLEEKLLGEDGSISMEKLSKLLIEDLESQDSDNNLLDSVQFKDGKLAVSLGAISGNSWLESRIISMINKEVIDVIMPGGSFIQRSAFGITSDTVFQDTMVNGGKALKMIDKTDGSMHAVVSINLFKHIIPGYNKMTFEQARNWLFEHNVIGQDSGPSAIGYRIPTQAQASISPLKFMDVLPENMGDIVILPEEFTKLTGSDFDIDKLFISRYAYDESGNKVQFNSELGFDGNTEDAIKNHMLENYLKVLTTLEYTNALKGSIDDATNTVKSIHKKLMEHRAKSGTTHVETFLQYTPWYQESKKAEYTRGKLGIGPFALNNANQVLTQLMNVQFKVDPFIQSLNLVSVAKQYDDDGSNRRIMDWLSAMINAFVDIAKDPYIVDMNVNAYTYNMSSYLLRMGKGEQMFYFMNQPVIRDVAEAVLRVRGKYGKDSTKTQSEIEKEATNEVLKQYGITRVVLDMHRDLLADKTTLAEHLKGIFNGELESMLFDQTDAAKVKAYQAKVWLAWQAFKPYADELANLVKYSKVDTKKMGKSFTEERLYEKGMDNMLTGSLIEDVASYYARTFIQKKTDNSVGFGRSLFAGQLLRTSTPFLRQLDDILYLIGKERTTNIKQVKPLVQAMEASIKSEFFNQFIEANKIDVQAMFHGKNSMAKRMIALTYAIKRGEYPELLSADGSIANELLNFLIPNTVKYEKNFREPDYIDTRTMFDQDVYAKNAIIQGWEELLEHPNERISTFARDLIVYSFITSGDNKNMNSFFDFVPASWRVSSGYSDFIQNKIDNREAEVTSVEDLFLNNWRNNDLVPTIDISYPFTRFDRSIGKNVTESRLLIGIESKNYMIGTTIKPMIIMAGHVGNTVKIKPITYRTEFDEQGRSVSVPVYPPYVKVKYDRTSNDPRSYMIYKLIGHTKVYSKALGTLLSPIYIGINKKGYDYKGHKMFEYGRNTVNVFNGMPIGITEKDTKNGNLERGIDAKNGPDWTDDVKEQRKKLFTLYSPLNGYEAKKLDIQIKNSRQTYVSGEQSMFEGLRQIRIKVPGSNTTVYRAKQIIMQLREAEAKSSEIDSSIELEISGTIYDDWNERLPVSKLFENKQFKRDVEDLLESYLELHPELDEIDFEQLSKDQNISEMLEKIVLESGAFIKEDPNQLSLFNDEKEFSSNYKNHCKNG